jgi:lambda family phage minor tail protein L
MVELFMLADFNPADPLEVFRFTPWRECTWLGQTWGHLDAKTSGFESNGRALPRPKIQVSNVQNAIGSIVKLYDDLLGATLWRYRTLENYIQTGSAEMLILEEWQIQQKTSQDNLAIEWELSALDLENKQLPGRSYQAIYCASQYRSVECGYSGLPVADINDQPTANPSLDDCGRKIGSCRLRFGDNAELPIDIQPGLQT